jgi:hypothetical protein
MSGSVAEAIKSRGALGEFDVVLFGTGAAEEEAAPVGGFGIEQIAGFAVGHKDVQLHASFEADEEVAFAVLDGGGVAQDAIAQSAGVFGDENEVDIVDFRQAAADGAGDLDAGAVGPQFFDDAGGEILGVFQFHWIDG